MAESNNEYHLTDEDQEKLDELCLKLSGDLCHTLKKAIFLAKMYNEAKKKFNEKTEEHRTTIGELSERVNKLNLENEQLKIQLKEELDKKDKEIEVHRKKCEELKNSDSGPKFQIEKASGFNFYKGNNTDEQFKQKYEAANKVIQEKDEEIVKLKEEIANLQAENGKLKFENRNQNNDINSLRERLNDFNLSRPVEETS